MYQGMWKKGQDIKEKESHFIFYFGRNISRIMDLDTEGLFTKDARYRNKFVGKLCESSLKLKMYLDKYKIDFIKSCSRENMIRIVFTKLVTIIWDGVQNMALNHTSKLLLTMINIYSAVYFLFYTRENINGSHGYKVFNSLSYTLLFWNLCSMIITEP